MTTPYRRGRKISVAIQLDPDQCESIDLISAHRRTSRAAVIREAVDLYLAENTSLTSTPSVDEKPRTEEQVAA